MKKFKKVFAVVATFVMLFNVLLPIGQVPAADNEIIICSDLPPIDTI